jgi:hypothetical protein
VSNDFAFGLFDLDWDVFSAHVDGAVHRVPVIGETGVKSTVCGPGNYNHVCTMILASSLLVLFQFFIFISQNHLQQITNL